MYCPTATRHNRSIGRFITEDPIKDGVNHFIYTANNPLKYVDPTGLYYDRNTGETTDDYYNGGANKSDFSGPKTGSPPAGSPKTPSTAPLLPGGKAGTPDSGYGDIPDEVAAQLAALGILPGPMNGIPEGILGQNDPALADIPYMSNKGCNLRALQAAAERYVGKALTADQIENAVEALQESEAVREDLFVKDPDKVINDALDRLGLPTTTATVGYGGGAAQPEATIIRGTTLSGNPHSQLGNSAGEKIWDPYNPDRVIKDKETRNIYFHRGN